MNSDNTLFFQLFLLLLPLLVPTTQITGILKLSSNLTNNDTFKVIYKSGIKPQWRIVNGAHAEPGVFPWQLQLQRNYKKHCGATLIKAYWAITAAHCISSKDKFHVMAGSTHWNGGHRIGVEKAIIHPSYDRKRFLNDIALIKLESSPIYTSDSNHKDSYLSSPPSNFQQFSSEIFPPIKPEQSFTSQSNDHFDYNNINLLDSLPSNDNLFDLTINNQLTNYNSDNKLNDYNNMNSNYNFRPSENSNSNSNLESSFAFHSSNKKTDLNSIGDTFFNNLPRSKKKSNRRKIHFSNDFFDTNKNHKNNFFSDIFKKRKSSLNKNSLIFRHNLNQNKDHHKQVTLNKSKTRKTQNGIAIVFDDNFTSTTASFNSSKNFRSVVEFNANSIKIPEYYMQFRGTATVVGWGLVSESDRLGTDHLMAANVEILNSNLCKNYLNFEYESQICAGYPSGGVDACAGDSGGGLVTMVKESPYLIGIVSYGIGCGRKNFPGVYTKVSHYKDWIESVTELD